MDDFRKYNGWGFFIPDFLKRPLKLVLGGLLYGWLLRRGEKTHYVVLPGFLGDSMAALSLLGEFKRQNRIAHVTVVGIPGFIRQLCGFYPDCVDDILYLKKWQVGSLISFSRSYLGQYLISFPHRERITFAWIYCNLVQRAFNQNRYFSLCDFVRTILYQLPPETMPEAPHVPELDVAPFAQKYGIAPGRTVFLNAVAKSVQMDVAPLFSELAELLAARGFRVLTFTANAQEAPVPGTQALPCSLAEAYRLAEYGGTVIGIRSGFLDLIVFAKCKLISLDDPEYGRRDLCEIEKWGVNGDSHSVTFDNAETAKEKILALMGGK